MSGPGSKLAALAAPMYDQTAAAGVVATLALRSSSSPPAL